MKKALELEQSDKKPLGGGAGSLLSGRGGVGCTFGRRCCCDDDSGDRLWGARCHVLLKLLCRNSLDADLKQIKVPFVTD